MLFLVLIRHLLRQIPRFSLWFAKHIGLLLYRNLNLQTLIIAPSVMVLLLLPAFFPAGDRNLRDAEKTTSVAAPTVPANYQSMPSWAGHR